MSCVRPCGPVAGTEADLVTTTVTMLGRIGERRAEAVSQLWALEIAVRRQLHPNQPSRTTSLVSIVLAQSSDRTAADQPYAEWVDRLADLRLLEMQSGVVLRGLSLARTVADAAECCRLLTRMGAVRVDRLRRLSAATERIAPRVALGTTKDLHRVMAGLRKAESDAGRVRATLADLLATANSVAA